MYFLIPLLWMLPAVRPSSVTYYSHAEFVRVLDGPGESLNEPCGPLWDFDASGSVDMLDAQWMAVNWSCDDALGECGVFQYEPAE